MVYISRKGKKVSIKVNIKDIMNKLDIIVRILTEKN